jgi:hypothetical protein
MDLHNVTEIQSSQEGGVQRGGSAAEASTGAPEPAGGARTPLPASERGVSGPAWLAAFADGISAQTGRPCTVGRMYIATLERLVTHHAPARDAASACAWLRDQSKAFAKKWDGAHPPKGLTPDGLERWLNEGRVGPPLATIEADIAGLNTSESAVLSRVKGAAQERNVKLATVKADLDHLMAYVQATADASPASAESIIEAAGMSTRKLVTHPKNDIKVEQGSVSGTAALIAKAVATRASYEWQYSTDQKTWTNAPTTLQAKTDIVGLTAGTAYFFRVRGVTKAGEQNWSQVVSLLMT